MDTVLRIALRVGMWAVLIGLLALLTAAVVVPRIFGARAYTILSPSMEPTLQTGSLVVVRPDRARDIGVGSVITFQLESGKPEVVTHRVVKQGVDKNGHPVFLTEGDANNTPDAIWVRPEQVRGTVWYTLPHVGRLSPLMPTHLREILIAGSGSALLLYASAMFLLEYRDRRRLDHVTPCLTVRCSARC